jgi:hypothetical protein
VRQCKDMQAMIQHACDTYPGKKGVYIPVFYWQDGAYPAVSVKSNFQQLWCKSNTFSPPHGKQNGTKNTDIFGLVGNK